METTHKVTVKKILEDGTEEVMMVAEVGKRKADAILDYFEPPFEMTKE